MGLTNRVAVFEPLICINLVVVVGNDVIPDEIAIDDEAGIGVATEVGEGEGDGEILFTII